MRFCFALFLILAAYFTVGSTHLDGQSVPARVSYFYQPLESYGTWYYLTDENVWAWQPDVVASDVDWQPYCDNGRWVWTTQGWYWSSDYPWGWAAFHYGRWEYRSHLRWVWFPDTTWAPAWVTWRTGDNYCGWAPLPRGTDFSGSNLYYYNRPVGANFDFGLPVNEYSFVELRFLTSNPRAHRIGAQRRRELFTRTSSLNRFDFTDNGIANIGIGRDPVVRAQRRPIRTVNILNSSTVHNRDSLTRNGSSVYRTPLSALSTGIASTGRNRLHRNDATVISMNRSEDQRLLTPTGRLSSSSPRSLTSQQSNRIQQQQRIFQGNSATLSRSQLNSSQLRDRQQQFRSRSESTFIPQNSRIQSQSAFQRLPRTSGSRRFESSANFLSQSRSTLSTRPDRDRSNSVVIQNAQPPNNRATSGTPAANPRRR